jgi:transaldolase/glucose-6-phosphate isomerase
MIKNERRENMSHQVNRLILKLGKYQTFIENRLDYWTETNFMNRLRTKDPTLWFSEVVPEITNRLGWLDLPKKMHAQLEEFIIFAEEVKSARFQHIVLLGMGGSSLAPDVFQRVFDNAEGYPELIVLDSTHPSAIQTVEHKIDLTHTFFIVASKSGTTTETLSLFKYFWEKVSQQSQKCGDHFCAITDPGTPLLELAKDKQFRRVIKATPDVGGRYSALSAFGLLPASLIGLDVHTLLNRAKVIIENDPFSAPSNEVLSFILGAVLGEVTLMGRDKVTFLTSQSLECFPIWLEQLIAESTGKNGKGIVPIVNEPQTSPKNYGQDRLFIAFYLETDENAELDKQIKILEAQNHPIIQIYIKEKMNIGQEMYRWETAVAATGAILGIHPFNQPNVQMAKDLAKKMMEKVENGIVNKEDADLISADNYGELIPALKSWINQAKKGDYIAIQAYLAPTPKTTQILQNIRMELLIHTKLATTIGYGPRFLHSTGQLHKGGPNSGLFLQIIDEPDEDLPVPETNYTFRSLIQAQALGDYQALKHLKRRVLRITLKRDVLNNLLQILKVLHGL